MKAGVMFLLQFNLNNLDLIFVELWEDLIDELSQRFFKNILICSDNFEA